MNKTVPPAGKDTSCLAFMYHGIDPGDGRYDSVSAGEQGYVIPRDVFAEHLEALTRSRRKMPDPDRFLSEVIDSLCLEGEILLTFDDGWASDYDVVFPLLKEKGIKAVFFITTDEVGRPGKITWPQLREMVKAGMMPASHGHTHAFLDQLTPIEQRRQLRRSREILQAQTGHPVWALSLPGGRYGRDTFAIARDCGYEAVFASKPVKPFRLEGLTVVGRVAVRAGYSAEWMRDLLEHQEERLRSMARGVAFRQFIRSALGQGLYVRLHDFIWKMRLVRGHAVAVRRAAIRARKNKR